jgi:Peptidase U49
LIAIFVPWDKDNLPNPERYLAIDKDFVEQPNIFYTHALNFIFAHEYIHALKHVDEIMNNSKEKSYYVESEKEADFDAIELMKKGIFHLKTNYLSVHIGITIAILSMLFFRPRTSGNKHPNIEDRLTSAFSQLKIEDSSPCWGIALIGIELWAEQFGLNLTWDKKLSDKDAFKKIINDVKCTNA